MTRGKRIRDTRLARGMSQTELADGIISASYISLLESDRRSPEQNVLEALASRLGTSAAFLETGQDDPDADRKQRLLRLRYADLALANGQHQEAAREYRELLDTDGVIGTNARWGLARTFEALGQIDNAIRELESLLEQSRAGAEMDPSLPMLLNRRCWLYREAGDLVRSVEVGEEARRELQQLGLSGSDMEVRLISTLAGSYWERGDWATAYHLVQHAIGLAENQGTRRARAAAYWNASLVAESRVQLNDAIRLAERALALFVEDGDERNIAQLRVDFAWILLRTRTDDLARAEMLLEQARTHILDTGTVLELARCDTEIARCRLYRGEPAEAAHLATDVLRRLGNRPVLEVCRAGIVYAQALADSGDKQGATAECQRVTRHLHALRVGRQAVTIWREVADLLLELGEPKEAILAYQELADAAGAVGQTYKATTTSSSKLRI